MSKEKFQSQVSTQMRVNQIKILDLYEEEAKEDQAMRKFLVKMATRINEILHGLDTKENEE